TELPCFGVPLRPAGTGRYPGLGFTNDSASAEEYLAKLARVHELPPLTAEEQELARRHAHAIFRLRPFRFESFRSVFLPVSRRGSPVFTNLHLRLRTPAEVEAAEDLRRFAAWASD